VIARKYRARNLRVFGSVARNEARPDSDVDLLVEFDPSSSGPTDRSHRMRRELRELLGRDVDLTTESALHWFVQPQVIAEAVPL
jgi:uncharacterized protein